MGIYDRDYYRSEGNFGGWAGSNRVCHWLIGINVLSFIIQVATRQQPLLGMNGPYTDWLALDPSQVAHGQVWRLLTYAFLHSIAWQHIVFNMLALWWFGRAVEDQLGSREFLAFYLTSAVFSGLIYCVYELAVYGINGGHTAIGASGAVTAIMIFFAMCYPKTTVLLFFVIPMPVIALVVLFVAFDVLGILGGRPDEHVAFAAHLGGALFGFLYFKFKWRLLKWWPTRMSMRPRRGLRPRLKVYREPDDYDTALANPAFEDSEMLEAQLDTVLEKVQRYGREALTERENQILLRASEVYKHRRK